MTDPDLASFVSRLTALEQRELSAFERGFARGTEASAFEVSELKAKLAKALGEIARLKRQRGSFVLLAVARALGMVNANLEQCVERIRELQIHAEDASALHRAELSSADRIANTWMLRATAAERALKQLQAQPQPDGPAADWNASPGEGTHAHREPGEAPNLGGNGVAMVREISKQPEPEPGPEWKGSWCSQCGFDVWFDEDGLCSTCGSTAVGDGSDEAIEIRAERNKLRAEIEQLREAQATTVDSIQPNGRCMRHDVFECLWCTIHERDELRAKLGRYESATGGIWDNGELKVVRGALDEQERAEKECFRLRSTIAGLKRWLSDAKQRESELMHLLGLSRAAYDRLRDVIVDALVSNEWTMRELVEEFGSASLASEFMSWVASLGTFQSRLDRGIALDRANERNALVVALCDAVDAISPALVLGTGPVPDCVVTPEQMKAVIDAREALRVKL